MNDEILANLGDILNLANAATTPPFIKDISVHHLPANQVDSTSPREAQVMTTKGWKHLPEPPPVSEATARVDKSDIHHQTTDFLSFIDREFQDHADQLRHRACMMRARANEFDDMADGLGINRDLLTRDTLRAVEDFDKTVRWLLEHAHIKPERA